MSDDMMELRNEARSLGINVRNYRKEKLMQMISEARQRPAVSAMESFDVKDREQEILDFLMPQIKEGLIVEFDDVSVTFKNYGKTICTNLSTPNSVIQRQVHAFLSPTIPVQRAS